MTDPHRWLEEVEGGRALAWVEAQNDRTLGHLRALALHGQLEADALDVLTTDDRIPYANLRNGFAYNFWQDDRHVRGIWRRASAEAYLAGRPQWETILDVDQLASDDDESWVFAGATPFRAGPTGAENGRCLVSLSLGGRDAVTIREFDVEAGGFVADGFVSPEAKQGADWLDADTLLIATNWSNGPTAGVTSSGYPRAVRVWRRGRPLDEAEELYAGDEDDVAVWPLTVRRADGSVLAAALRSMTFFTSSYQLFPDRTDPVPLPIPPQADLLGTVDDRLLVALRQDWDPTPDLQVRSGDLVSFELGPLLEHGELSGVTVVFRPGERQAIQQVAVSAGRGLLVWSDNVVARLDQLDPEPGGGWARRDVALPGRGQARVVAADRWDATVLVGYEDFLNPDSLYVLDGHDLRVAWQGARRFDATGLSVTQEEAVSPDGTTVPYFLVGRADRPGDGSTPTLLYGYGGFEVPMTPAYSPTIGRLWLERGGAYALANIRGGGEFGPAWHQAGLKGDRQRVYDDFIAVGEHLVATGVTSPERLGIMGGSNGGLLMGVMLNQRPDLWNAVVLQVPLLDMLRYHLLLAGASWIDEYGSPDDPAEREFLESISPYHRFDPSVDHPTPLFVTSTRDDRVHPGHARKLAKRFEEAGQPFWYFEKTDGGHGAATTQVERAERVALEMAYLWSRVGP